MHDLEYIKENITEVQDYPVQGVSYKDITTLIENGEAMHRVVDLLSLMTDEIEYSKVLCAEARGFVFGTALAYSEKKGIVLARRPNKLPRETISVHYDLEYGSDVLEIHNDSVLTGEKVLVVDDLLATGGTAKAMCELVEDAGGVVAGTAFLIELSYLRGRKRLADYPVFSLVYYEI